MRRREGGEGKTGEVQDCFLGGEVKVRRVTYWQSPSAGCQQHCCHLHKKKKNNNHLWLN